MDRFFEDIESHEFAARVNVASNLVTFLRGARSQVSVIGIFEELEKEEKLFQVLTRLIDLSKKTVDPRYENPWDTALAVYLWLVSLKSTKAASLGAQFILQSPQCWWAERIARSILLGRSSQEKINIQNILPLNPKSGDLNLSAGESLAISDSLGEITANLTTVWLSHSDCKTDVMDQSVFIFSPEEGSCFSNTQNQESARTQTIIA